MQVYRLNFPGKDRFDLFCTWPLRFAGRQKPFPAILLHYGLGWMDCHNAIPLPLSEIDHGLAALTLSGTAHVDEKGQDRRKGKLSVIICWSVAAISLTASGTWDFVV